jgi:hypothetical protein
VRSKRQGTWWLSISDITSLFFRSLKSHLKSFSKLFFYINKIHNYLLTSSQRSSIVFPGRVKDFLLLYSIDTLNVGAFNYDIGVLGIFVCLLFGTVRSLRLKVMFFHICFIHLPAYRRQRASWKCL